MHRSVTQCSPDVRRSGYNGTDCMRESKSKMVDDLLAGAKDLGALATALGSSNVLNARHRMVLESIMGLAIQACYDLAHTLVHQADILDIKIGQLAWATRSLFEARIWIVLAVDES